MDLPKVSILNLIVCRVFIFKTLGAKEPVHLSILIRGSMDVTLRLKDKVLLMREAEAL